ncbi:hypothetical protein LZ31DRAFT_105302 [Colletotrichum somersetense]|nr:hypothetical protein LZ31DRAFT_105302 [Colletotrichum somersetense]
MLYHDHCFCRLFSRLQETKAYSPVAPDEAKHIPASPLFRCPTTSIFGNRFILRHFPLAYHRPVHALGSAIVIFSWHSLYVIAPYSDQSPRHSPSSADGLLPSFLPQELAHAPLPPYRLEMYPPSAQLDIEDELAHPLYVGADTVWLVLASMEEYSQSIPSVPGH